MSVAIGCAGPWLAACASALLCLACGNGPDATIDALPGGDSAGFEVPDGSAGPGFSIRFHGNGVDAPDLDRIKIRIDDPDDDRPGPPVDIGDTDFTIEFWLLADAADNSAPAVTCGDNIEWINGNIIIDRDRFNQDRKYGLSLADGQLVFGVSGDGTGAMTICGTSDVRDQVWHHVAIQRARADGAMQLYVDGTLEAEGDGPDGDISYPDDGVPQDQCNGPCINSDPFIVLGAEKHDAGAQYPSFNGYFDELRISTTLRYAGEFAPPTGPFATDGDTVGLYHFDEGSGDMVGDSSNAPGGPSPGARQFGGTPPGPEWSEQTPW